MKKVLRLQKVSSRKGGGGQVLTYSHIYSKVHNGSHIYSQMHGASPVYSLTHQASDNGGSRVCKPE